MVNEAVASLPPLQGCLYCHAEGATALAEGRKILGFGGNFPILKCSHCGSIAQLDTDAPASGGWRIRYRHVNRASQYYYVAIRLGKAGWLSAQEALAISTDGYAQRVRVHQTKEGDFLWLHPARLSPPPPFMNADEKVYMTLKAVTCRETPPRTLFWRPDRGPVLDSGKLYVTDQNLYLLGQRRDWSNDLEDICDVEYEDTSWTIFLETPGQLRHYHGANVTDQLDPQLVATVIESLQAKTETSSDFAIP
ncbi:MAG: hypothetical protein JXJ20_05940 [Anaerolineae bacterium]|nr:hypothetical protein [Anaerolineae bacterium]